MMPSTHTVRPAAPARRERRGNPLLRERVHDPYRLDAKPRTPARCQQCGALYRNGRWVWARSQPREPKSTLCPACRRINDKYPAGEITLAGSFMHEHAEDILRSVRNVERRESQEHPLHRIVDTAPRGDLLVITTTDVHLPRQIGHALVDAWGGELATHYDDEGYFVRVSWRRD